MIPLPTDGFCLVCYTIFFLTGVVMEKFGINKTVVKYFGSFGNKNELADLKAALVDLKTAVVNHQPADLAPLLADVRKVLADRSK